MKCIQAIETRVHTMKRRSMQIHEYTHET